MLLLIYLFLSIVFIVYATSKWKIHPFLVLLMASFFFGFLADLSSDKLLKAIQTGFGDTLGNIGLIIIMGILIGTYLEKTGAALQLAQLVFRIIGAKRLLPSMATIGFIISIPVFVDAGFVLMNSLNKLLTKRAGLSISSTAVALGMGLMASHTMVPPTPGPVAATTILGANIGLVLFWGIVIGLISLVPIVLFSQWIGKRVLVIPPSETKDVETDGAAYPSKIISVLPIALPICLIVGKSMSQLPQSNIPTNLQPILSFLGTPVIALSIGFILSLFLLTPSTAQKAKKENWIGQALSGTSDILLITGAGGIFGKVLQESGLGDSIGQIMENWPLGIWLPFLLATTIKTAQGSSTIAMITTASIVAPLMPSLSLHSDTATALTVVAIGAGSVMISHVNDSYFWVVTKLTGLSVAEGYKTHSLGSIVLGLSAMLLCVFFLAFFSSTIH
ncbi:MAG: GntP family permease [Spirosomataceae bacterium]